MSNFIIQVEGLNRSGKSTLITRLCNFASCRGTIGITKVHMPNYDGIHGSIIKSFLSGENSHDDIERLFKENRRETMLHA